MNEGGVRTLNNLELYSLNYISDNKLLENGEKISAYFDYTILLDGTEAAILTDSRLIYHNKETITTSVNYSDIKNIDYKEESLIGYTIEITNNDSEVITIEIPPANNAEIFIKILKAKVKQLN